MLDKVYKEQDYFEQNQYKLGILGGTFDPIHIGHLLIAETARIDFGLDKVLFIPAGHPPHKLDQNVLNVKHRYNMTKIAIKDNSYFDISSIEIEREGKSFTIDTLNQLKVLYPDWNKPYFIIGGDTLLEIKTWRKSEEIMKICKFIVYNRPGYNTDDVMKEADMLTSKNGADISFLDGPMIDISSTQVRQRLINGKSIKYIVPYEVEKYIYTNFLYMGDGGRYE